MATLASPDTSDFRARLKPLYPSDIYGPANAGIMTTLNETNGVIFPYTPTISFSQAVNYADLSLVHSNTDYPAYVRTPSVTLSVSGKFTVQNEREGIYALAVIHFLRTVSKSYFGEIDAAAGKAGLPPPILEFSAYGAYMYNNLRCILKSHAWSYDETMDTIVVPVPAMNGNPAASVRLPPLFTIQMELQVVQTPTRMRENFSFDAFASGKLMGRPDGGWI